MRLRRLLSRWVLSGLGVLLLAILVWVFGPLLAALAGTMVRFAVVIVFLLVWLAANLLLDRARRRRERTLEAGVAATGPDPGQREIADEQAALAEKLAASLALLRRARGTRGALYELPWYAIIGPPGAGKTTALLNAGLSFPLAAELGHGAVAGVGGTRLCDWWFTDQAVLIDTAGRYTLQDSNEAVDRAGWQGFLSLLRRTRPRQPLNGVLVAIALSDIAGAARDERLAHARAIRARIRELDETLGLRLPVYALLTKADLIAGFTEFFDDLDRQRREQVWGATFDATLTQAGPIEGFANELRLLVERLRARLFDRLQAERSPERRALIAGFPSQIATLAEPLGEFLREAFGGSKLDPAPFLRGVYLASGTQAGTPIDRLTGEMARNFGLDQRRLPSLRAERGRSYFLGGLLRLVFGEAMLVRERPGAARQRMLIRVASFGGVALLALVAIGAMLGARASGQRQVTDVSAALDGYEKVAATVPLDPIADSDLPALLPVLDAARALTRETVPGGIGFGLSQASKLHAGAQAVYRHALDYALLPRMIWRLEAQMRGNLQRPDFLYEATRVYLMLGGQGPLDRALIREWMTLDWQTTYPGAFNGPMLAELATHLEALLREPLPAVPLDGALVAQARNAFSRVSLAERVYSRIKPSAAASRMPPWRPSDAIGPAGLDVFVRASGKPLSDGIPGFLTVRGFHLVLLPALVGAAHDVAAESWVLGHDERVDTNGDALRALERSVIALYEQDYETAWDAMLADLDIVPLRSPGEAAQDLYILTSPQSPMKSLLASIARQLTLSAPPADMPGAKGGPLAGAPPAVVAETARLSSLLGVGSAAAATLPPGYEIDARYQALRDLVSRDNGAGIDQSLKPLADLQQLFAKMAAAPLGAPPAVIGNDPILAVRATAQGEPAPVSRWLLAMADQTASLRGGDAKQQVAASYNGATGPASLCPLAVNGRFPFTANSTLDTPTDDFTKLFAPGGMLDGFFNTQLKPYVNTTGRTWTPQPSNGVAAPVDADAVAQFQRASMIRDLFFVGGSATPRVTFTITPVRLDDGANQVGLDFDGTDVAYSHGPPRSTEITWPGPTGMQNVRLVFDPPPAGGTGVLSASGPWAMFRMFAQGTLAASGSPDSYTLTYTLGNREAVFAIRAGSVLNPFAPGLLDGFRCPIVQ